MEPVVSRLEKNCRTFLKKSTRRDRPNGLRTVQGIPKSHFWLGMCESLVYLDRNTVVFVTGRSTKSNFREPFRLRLWDPVTFDSAVRFGCPPGFGCRSWVLRKAPIRAKSVWPIFSNLDFCAIFLRSFWGCFRGQIGQNLSFLRTIYYERIPHSPLRDRSSVSVPLEF